MTLRAVVAHAGTACLPDRADLRVSAHGLLGIVGPDGAGKSSLLRAALSVLHATSGEISIDARLLHEWPQAAFAHYIGYGPQHAHSHWISRWRNCCICLWQRCPACWCSGVRSKRCCRAAGAAR